MKFLVKLAAGALATAAAVWLVPGITLQTTTTSDAAWTLLLVTAVLAVINAVVRPFAKFLSFCLLVITFGAFILVINALMLMLTSWVCGEIGLGFHVEGFWPALFGSIIISIITTMINAILARKKRSRRRAW